MIVVLRPNLPPEEIDKVVAEVAKMGYEPRTIRGGDTDRYRGDWR